MRRAGYRYRIGRKKGSLLEIMSLWRAHRFTFRNRERPHELMRKTRTWQQSKTGCIHTLGAIAMQGLRQADLRLGESCAVIGLGSLGNLLLILKGIRRSCAWYRYRACNG